MNIHDIFPKIRKVASSCPGWKEEEFLVEPGRTHVRLDMEFGISGGARWRGETGHIKAMLKPVKSGRSSEVVTDSGIRKVTYELELDEPITIRQGGHGERTVEEATTRMFLYRRMLDVASSMQTILMNMRITHSWYELPEVAEEPDDLDRWAHLNDIDKIMQWAYKSDIQNECSKYDLPISGTKDELRRRLLDYAIENGKPGRYQKKLQRTLAGEFATLAEAREAL